MKTSAWTTFFYGLLILGGGAMGFLKAGSALSLVFGTISGLFFLGVAMSLWKQKIAGLYCSLIYTVLLDAFFTYRLLKTHQFMPSGLMCLLSLAYIAFITTSIRKMAKSNTGKNSLS